MRLKDKVVVITGGSGALCSVIAKGLFSEGAKIALISRTESKLLEKKKEMTAENDPRVMICAADVTDSEALVEIRDKVISEWGKIDILINGAGGNNPKGTSQLEELRPDSDLNSGFFGMEKDAFSSILNLNILGTILPSQVFGESMVKAGNGSIINISSMAAQLPLTKVGGYSAAKAAIDNFTRWLAVHFAKTGVRVNAIAPGFFISEQNHFLLFLEDGKTLTERGKKIISQTPMNRFGKAEELISSVLFLSEEASRFITGIIIPIDGGFSAYSGV